MAKEDIKKLLESAKERLEKEEESFKLNEQKLNL